MRMEYMILPFQMFSALSVILKPVFNVHDAVMHDNVLREEAFGENLFSFIEILGSQWKLQVESQSLCLAVVFVKLAWV